MIRHQLDSIWSGKTLTSPFPYHSKGSPNGLLLHATVGPSDPWRLVGDQEQPQLAGVALSWIRNLFASEQSDPRTLQPYFTDFFHHLVLESRIPLKFVNLLFTITD